jgi:DNA-binding CsgD family transcriptional regulator
MMTHELATDRAGRLLWCTPKAARLLADAAFDHGAFRLPCEIVARLARTEPGRNAGAGEFTIGLGDGRLDLVFLGEVAAGECLFRVARHDSRDEPEALMARLALTAREAEVLTWIARGKSNRDIGEILGISPRTVNKHLEQIFTKLGIENRASAAAVAVRELALLA